MSTYLLPIVLTLLVLTGTAHATKCVHPSVRKEWRSMSVHERADWISAVKCLTTFPHTDTLTPLVDPAISLIPPVNTSSSYYDDFVYMHMDLNTRIHSTGQFLPFHRWYVAVYENALRDKCGFKGASPYWDWTKDSSDLYGSAMFQDSNTKSGMGGWGSSTNDFQITDGGFHDFVISYPVPHVVRRNFTLQPFLNNSNVLITDPEKYANDSFTPSEINQLINGFVGDFVGFQQYFEAAEGAHASIHLVLGGDLSGACPKNSPKNCVLGSGPTWSANEPLFWLHHAMVDKVWFDWQHKKPSNFWAFQGGSVQNITSLAAAVEYPNGMPPLLNFNSTIPADGMFPEVNIYDVFNTTGGYLCYIYE